MGKITPTIFTIKKTIRKISIGVVLTPYAIQRMEEFKNTQSLVAECFLFCED